MENGLTGNPRHFAPVRPPHMAPSHISPGLVSACSRRAGDAGLIQNGGEKLP